MADRERVARAPRVVAAVGGNAFVRPGEKLTMAGQFRFARDALLQLRPLLLDYRLVLAHGNGPQVGHMLTRVEQSLGQTYSIPLEVCVAESEGELGYVLMQTMHNVLCELGRRRSVATLLTQVVVDPKDPAFGRPTKPIGPHYDATRARALEAQGFALCEERGRGFRRVVPSPEPRAIIDVDIVEQLLDMDVVVIAAGGGGIPVVQEQGRLRGVDAVIDKDLTAAMLADRIDAELFVIITGVPCAYTDFGTSRQQPIGVVRPEDVRALAAEGHFPPGSMGPKMEAAARFVTNERRRAIVCDPATLAEALAGRGGTLVRRSLGKADDDPRVRGKSQ